MHPNAPQLETSLLAVLGEQPTVVAALCANDVCSCRHVKLPAHSADPLSGDPYIDIGNASEAVATLRRVATVCTPAVFTDWEVPVVVFGEERTRGLPAGSMPPHARAVTRAEHVADAAVLRWCEQIAHCDGDGGEAYETMMAALPVTQEADPALAEVQALWRTAVQSSEHAWPAEDVAEPFTQQGAPNALCRLTPRRVQCIFTLSRLQCPMHSHG